MTQNTYGNYIDQYQMMNDISKWYDLLEDNRSKEIFLARLEYDVVPNFSSLMRIINASGIFPKESNLDRIGWKVRFEEIKNNDKTICLYGGGVIGKQFSSALLQSGFDSFVFCDKYKTGMVDKIPIISPQELISESEKFYVIVTVTSSDEVIDYLLENNFPKSHILFEFSIPNGKYNRVNYFELSEYIPSTGAFVDAGSFDGLDVIRFMEIMNCSDCIVFEPDPENYKICVRRLKNCLKVENIFQAGLSDKSGNASFLAEGTETSCMIDDISSKDNAAACECIIRTVALDDISIQAKIAMIKMDIEGAEYKALCGAKNTIKRDEPFLAISVYHKRGDLIAIMSLLKYLVPSYRFALRHYTPGIHDTVLYAFK